MKNIVKRKFSMKNKMNLSLYCEYRKEKVNISDLNLNNYISTENMLSNKGGVKYASSLPMIDKAQKFKKGDILISNIRPYFKKIWKAEFDGGCSNDVLVLCSKKNINEDFLYYALSENRFFEYCMGTSKGTKMPRGDKESIMKYKIPYFETKEQIKISKILKNIDKKILLNKTINKNLVV